MLLVVSSGDNFDHQYSITMGAVAAGGEVAEWVRALAWTGDRTVPGRVQIPLRKRRFGTLAIPFTPLCQCLSEETLKAVGPFYLVSMPGEVKYSTSPHWKYVTVVDSTTHSKCPPPRSVIVALAYCPV